MNLFYLLTKKKKVLVQIIFLFFFIDIELERAQKNMYFLMHILKQTKKGMSFTGTKAFSFYLSFMFEDRF